MKILWIAFVWPEPYSSAAGARTLSLLKCCRAAGFSVTVASACQENAAYQQLIELGISVRPVQVNHSSFDEFVTELNPDLVVFDRFMIEEQFSWRVRQCCPSAARVLDSVDLHSLRRLREERVKNQQSVFEFKDQEILNEDALREVAAIYRSDLTLIISDAELKLLRERYGVPESLLELCSLFYERPSSLGAPFEERKNLVFIGNFRHAPNLDAVRYLKREGWKQIRQLLSARGAPEAELHIYGAYPTKEAMQFDDPASKFRVFGPAEDALETLGRYRVNLAPLRFGAGLKGKISDGWAAGTPCVATEVAAEGMSYQGLFGGLVVAELSSFPEKAVELYLNSELWRACQERGAQVISKLFNAQANSEALLSRLASLRSSLADQRAQNVVGSLLWYQGNRSTEYFSRWIEAKSMVATPTE